MKLVFNLSALQVTVATMADLYSTVISDLYLGRLLPKNFDDYDLKSLKFISDYYNGMLYSGNFAAVISTPFLRLLRMNIKNVIEGNNKKKLSIFEVHESNIYPLLTTLNLTSADCLNQRWKNQTITSLNCM
jgi:hypothetical protein